MPPLDSINPPRAYPNPTPMNITTPTPHTKNKEQGVSVASLQTTLSVAHCVRAQRGVDGAVTMCACQAGKTAYTIESTEEPSGVCGGRTHCVSSRFSPTELEQLRRDSAMLHKRMGQLLRESYFAGGAGHISQLNQEAWGRLSESLDGLHDLAQRLNSGELPEDLRPILSELVGAVMEIRDALVGGTK